MKTAGRVLVISILISITNTVLVRPMQAQDTRQVQAATSTDRLVQNTLVSLVEHINSGDSAHAVSYFTDDGVLDLERQPYKAADSLGTLFQRWHNGGLTLHMHPRKAVRSGETITNIGSMKLQQGESIVREDEYVIQWQKIDGQWKIVIWRTPTPGFAETSPVQLQRKGVYNLGQQVYLSNDFPGARMNGAIRLNDSLISMVIMPENEPINQSPWYAFKIWSDTPQNVDVRLIYGEHVSHRYYPKVSRDGKHWEPIDSAAFRLTEERVWYGDRSRIDPVAATMSLSIGPDTLWVSGQELVTSADTQRWVNRQAEKPFVRQTVAGKSREGRDIHALRIGTGDGKRMVVVLSRQHPPEVTGYLAMQSFIKAISADSELAKAYRAMYTTYVFPMVNPDGVDQGHWRHNSGGVDLNRNWVDFNQPETRSVRDFMLKKVADSKGKIYFSVDFHSIWSEDLYYTVASEDRGNKPGLISALIENNNSLFPDNKSEVSSSGFSEFWMSHSFFFDTFGSEAMIYEVADDTPRDFIDRKAVATAQKLMELLTQ